MEENKDKLNFSEEPENVNKQEDAFTESENQVPETAPEELSEDITGGEDTFPQPGEIVDAEFTEDVEIITEDEIPAETAVVSATVTVTPDIPDQPQKKKKGLARKIFKSIGILLLIAFLALSGFVAYKVWDYLQVYVYTVQHDVPVTFSNETISLSIDNMEIIDEILGFEMDENYVYLGVTSTVTNKAQEPLEWKSFPLLMVREFTVDEENTGYILIENTDQPFEMTGLRNYAIDLELDLRPAKDNLEAGSSRTTADIFKIPKADYEAKTYFLTTDIFNETVKLPSLPAPEVETTPAE